MTVRDILPDSIAFTVELRLSTVKRYRVRNFRFQVILDLPDRWLTIPSRILFDIDPHLDEFLVQMSMIAAHQWAYTKWASDRDLMTEFQTIHIYPFYQVDRDRLKFNITLSDSHPVSTEELILNTLIQL